MNSKKEYSKPVIEDENIEIVDIILESVKDPFELEED